MTTLVPTSLALLLALPALAAPAVGARGPLSSPVALEEPFTGLPVEDARAKAKDEKRVLVLFFHNPESPESRRLVSSTFADPGVRTWLRDHALAALVLPEDAETGRRYSVASYPTMLFLNVGGEDAKLLHMFEGFRDATEFLVAANSAVLSMGKIEHPDGETSVNPMAWLAWGNWLFTNDPKRADETLDAYLWCLDNGEEHLHGFRALHLEFLLERIAYLKPHTSRAVQSLWDRRGALRNEILAGEASDRELEEYLRFNYWLRDEIDALQLFDELAGLEGGRRQELRVMVMRKELALLTAWRRYEPILAIEPRPLEHIEARLKGIEAAEAEAAEAAAEGKVDSEARNALVDDAASYFEALLAVGKGADAMELMERAVGAVCTGRSYRAFIERTNRLGLFSLTKKIGDMGLEKVEGKSRRLIEIELRRAEDMQREKSGISPFPGSDQKGGDAGGGTGGGD